MLLNLLLNHCAKQEIFHKLVDPDALISTLSVLLETPGSAVRLLSLLCISYFIDDSSLLMQHFCLFGEDLIALKIRIEKKLMSVTDGLHFLRRASEIHKNLEALQQYGIPEFLSQFLDSSENESTVAAEILTHLLSDSDLNDSSLTINEKMERASTALLSGSLSSIAELHSRLQSVLRTLESDMKKSLKELSLENLNIITTKLCLYIKMHSQGKM